MPPRRNPMTKTKKTNYTGDIFTGWVCGVCGRNAKPDVGFTQMDPRYQMGECPVHHRVALRKDDVR